MKLLKMTLSGKAAHFKNPEINANVNYTYGHIHKVALLGLFGAIRGYQGYKRGIYEDQTAIFPEFYDRLKHLKIAIVPKAQNGYFKRKIQIFNNSCGVSYGRKPGGIAYGQTWIIKEQVLEKPEWDIYVLIDNQEAVMLAEYILNHKCIYIPYLGKNEFYAEIHNIKYTNGERSSKESSVDSLICEKDIDAISGFSSFIYKEQLPIGLESATNLYIKEEFILTDQIIKSDQLIVVDNKKVLYLF